MHLTCVQRRLGTESGGNKGNNSIKRSLQHKKRREFPSYVLRKNLFEYLSTMTLDFQSSLRVGSELRPSTSCVLWESHVHILLTIACRVIGRVLVKRSDEARFMNFAY